MHSSYLYPSGHRISQKQLTSRHGVKPIAQRVDKPKCIGLYTKNDQHYLRVQVKPYCPDSVNFTVKITGRDFDSAYWKTLAKLCTKVYFTDSELAAFVHRLDQMRSSYLKRLCS